MQLSGCSIWGSHRVAPFGPSTHCLPPRVAAPRNCMPPDHQRALPRTEQADMYLQVVFSHLEAWDGAVPGCEALGVLSSHAGCGPVGSPENDGAVDLTRGHVQRLRRRVDDLVDGLHRKVPGHELAHRLQAGEGGTHSNACKPGLRAATPQVRLLTYLVTLLGQNTRKSAEDTAVAVSLPSHRPTSVIGVSFTRSGPYFCSRPRVICRH